MPRGLVMRTQQIEAFDRCEREKFENKVLASLRQHWAEEVARRGEAGARESIRKGIQQAKAHGLESERDIMSYINLMYLCGDDFDVDPSYPWAAEILDDAALQPSARIDRLVEEVRKRGASAT